MSDKKREYIDKLDAQLREWSAKIDELKAGSGRVKASLKLEYDKQMQMLRIKLESAQQKLQELKDSGEQVSDDLKGAVKKIWEDLKTTLDNAISRFR